MAFEFFQVVLRPAQIAPYRNPGYSQPGHPTGQGLVQAGVIIESQLQSLVQATPGAWTYTGIDGGTTAQQVVAAIAMPGTGPPTVNDVNLFWSTGSGITTTSLAGAGTWNPSQPVTSLPNLSWLQVAYTPTGHPVVYGVDSSDDLWTYNWSGSAWTTTSYSAGSLGWGNLSAGFTLIAQNDTSWTVFAGSATANELIAVQGAFGGGVTASFPYNGTPTAGGFASVVGGGLSQPAPSPNGSEPCAFYIDSGSTVMMWPNSLANDVAVPTLTDQGQTDEGANLPPAVTVNAFPNPDARHADGLSAAGSGTTFYQADGAGNVVVMRQLAWVFDNQLPYFSPPSLVAAVEAFTSGPPQGVAPLPRPIDVPAVFAIDFEGNLFEFELNGSRGTWDGQSGQNQWSGGQITPQSE